jgi:hypothetical protein
MSRETFRAGRAYVQVEAVRKTIGHRAASQSQDFVELGGMAVTWMTAAAWWSEREANEDVA